jgi:hypothetical protein
VIPLGLLAVVLLAFALAAMRVIDLWVAVAAVLAAVLVAGWQLDRRAGPGGHPGPRDRKRFDFFGRASHSQWEPPTSYIDHPTGVGEPPGANRGDEPLPRK